MVHGAVLDVNLIVFVPVCIFMLIVVVVIIIIIIIFLVIVVAILPILLHQIFQDRVQPIFLGLIHVSQVALVRLLRLCAQTERIRGQKIIA
jgi:hypothetical protein